MLKQSWLGSLLLSHRRRILVFGAVSLIGSALLYTGVTYLNLDPNWVNRGLSPVMLFVGFFVIRRYGFPDRKTAKLPGLGKWILKWMLMTPFSQYAFTWLVEEHDYHFLVAKVIVGAAACIPGYLITNLVVFAHRGFGVRRASGHVRVIAIRVWALGIEKA